VLARTVTHALVGLEARKVEGEAHLQGGVPGLAIVGLADRACQEAKERVKSSIRAAERNWPGQRIVVNLAPAALKKEGSGFDLPIALAILGASRQVPLDRLAEHAAVGELALDGRLRPVDGAIVAAEGARNAGLDRILCAAESSPEAALAGIEPVPVRHLAEAVAYLRGEIEIVVRSTTRRAPNWRLSLSEVSVRSNRVPVSKGEGTDKTESPNIGTKAPAPVDDATTGTDSAGRLLNRIPPI
jgi:magnesium chelatase family protein